MSHLVKLGAFGLVFVQKGKFVVCRRRDFPVWDLPGGGVDAGESPWSAVTREIKEETGLDAKVKRLFVVQHKLAQNEVSFGFICEAYSGTFHQTTEAEIVELATWPDLPSPFHSEERHALTELWAKGGECFEGHFFQNIDGPAPRELWLKRVYQ